MSTIINHIEEVSVSLNAGSTVGSVALTQAVDPDDSVVFPNGFKYDANNEEPHGVGIRAELIDTGSFIEVAKDTSSDDAGICRVSVVEFTDGTLNSMQTGSVVVTENAYTGTDEINAVNTNKALLVSTGVTNGSPATDESIWSYLALRNGSIVEATRHAKGASHVHNYQVAEFSN